LFDLNNIFGIPAAYAQVSTAVNQVGEQTGGEFSKLIGNFFAAIPLWIAAVVIAVLSYIVALMVKRSIENKMAEKGIEEEHKEIQIVAGRSAYFIVLVIGITISLSIVGIDLKPIVAAGAFGLGFALQDIMMNTISGMLILTSRHYTIGDVIKVGGVVGRIMEIQTRATIIKAFDGTKVIVPNAQLFKNVVVSKTSNPFRKLSFVMGVGYGSDLKQVMNLTLDIIKSIPHVLASPKPSVIFYEWGDYSINFRINVWIDSKGGRMVKVKNHLIMELTKAYDQVGFNVPYPIQTIQLDKADQAEIKKDEIKERVAKMRSQLANGKPPKDPVKHYIVTPIASTPGPASLATTLTPQQPSSAPAPLPVNPSPEPQKLPTAIATTPNSPGQSWLQQALQTQVAQTAAPSVETPPSPVPAATIPPTQTDIQPSVS
jgi:small-conductance mechanosensitive channel